MADQTHASDILSDGPDRQESASLSGQTRVADYDVAIVGASLAGCATAILLSRTGARVALVEKSPDTQAYKRICTHYIQSSAVPAIERLGLLQPMMQAGAVRSRARLWTRWGWVGSPPGSTIASGINLRRSVLDPLVRQAAADTPGVDLMPGLTVHELSRERDRVSGVLARDKHGATVKLRSRLVVGTDGRDSRVAKLSGVRAKTVRHGRFAYGGYFEGPAPVGYPDASLWLLDPDMAAVFPTDSELNFYAVMPTMAHLPRFREDPAKALVEFVAAVPEAPPILASRPVEPVQGKIDMTNVAHTPTAPGLALVGDAALAIDPLWGVGCGWAFQSAEWLADSVAPAFAGAEPLEKGLKRYRRRHARKLGGHAMMMRDYTSGRKFNRGEKGLFFAASNDDRVAATMEAFATRNIGPARMFASTLPRTTLFTTRHALRERLGLRTAAKRVEA
jgi:2-polyprenyl-6-methoxyphenol hydroxylase-like FAD-dependent oxidoreductase